MFESPANTMFEKATGQHTAVFRFFLVLMGALYVLSGVMHFVATPVFVSIVPPYLPYPRALVYVSGVAEIAGGVGVWVPRTRRMAAWGLIVLLIAVFPANVTMLQHADLFPGIPRWALLVRLPVQLVLIAWAALYTRRSAQILP